MSSELTVDEQKVLVELQIRREVSRHLHLRIRPESADLTSQDFGMNITKAASAGWEAWPFDRPFHLILNLAVGGDWGGQRGVDEDAFSGEGQVMEVAWVRVYGCPGAAF